VFPARTAGSEGDSGSTSIGETGSTNSAPATSIDAPNNRSKPRRDRYEVDWSVGDDDQPRHRRRDAGLLGQHARLGDEDVSGSSVSGVDEIRSKQNGTDIVVIATDTDGASGSDSQSIRPGGRYRRCRIPFVRD